MRSRDTVTCTCYSLATYGHMWRMADKYSESMVLSGINGRGNVSINEKGKAISETILNVNGRSKMKNEIT